MASGKWLKGDEETNIQYFKKRDKKQKKIKKKDKEWLEGDDEDEHSLVKLKKK